MSTVTQVKLVSAPEVRGNEKIMTQMVTWLPSDNRIKEGVYITLKGDKKEYRVEEVYNTELLSTIDNRGWDNNNYDKHDGTSFKDRS